MRKKLTFYTEGRPYVLTNIEEKQAEELTHAVKRSWEAGSVLTFSYAADGVLVYMRSDRIEAMSMEDWYGNG